MTDILDKYVYWAVAAESKSVPILCDLIVRTSHEGHQAIIATFDLRTPQDTEKFNQRMADLKACIRTATEESRKQ